MRAVLFIVGLIALSGCKLLDQETFAPSPEATPDLAKLAKMDPRTPLVTIGYAVPNPDYKDVLHYAVGTAESRAPGVQYDVVALLPAGTDAAVAQGRAQDVMRDIMEQKVPAARIHLALRGVPAGTPQEVRVYLR